MKKQLTKNKALQKILLVILKVGITGFCVFHVFEQFGSEINILDRHISWLYVFWAILAFAASQIIAIWRWNICCARLNVGIPSTKVIPKQLFKYYFIGLFSNNFIPGSFGGDLIRAYLLKKNIQNTKWVNCVGSVFIDRASGLFAMTLLALGACYLLKTTTNQVIPNSITNVLAMASAAWCLGLATLFIISRFIPDSLEIEAEQEANLSFFEKIKFKAFEFLNAIRKVKRHPASLVGIILSSVLIQVLVSFCLIALAHGFDLTIEPGCLWIINSLATLGTLFTPSINGLGVRESIFAYFFTSLKLSGGEGVILSASWLLTILLVSLPGLFYMIGSFRSKSKTAKQLTEFTEVNP